MAREQLPSLVQAGEPVLLPLLAPLCWLEQLESELGLESESLVLHVSHVISE
jgi:hypothetical protein